MESFPLIDTVMLQESIVSFSEKLESVKSRFQSEFNLLLQFVNTTEKTLTEKFEKITDPELTGDDKKKMGELISFVDNDSDGNGLSIESEAIAKLLMSRIVPIKHKSIMDPSFRTAI